jgi:hypothetical protein
MLSQFPVWLPAAGRVMFASYFLLMGASHLIHFREHSGFLGRKGVPWARAATLLTILMMIGGGLLTMFDWHRSVGAVLLFGISSRRRSSCTTFGMNPRVTAGSASSRISSRTYPWPAPRWYCCRAKPDLPPLPRLGVARFRAGSRRWTEAAS